ncbi:NRDE family protein [Paraburkholderia phytofirmans OLGA172]|uniref:NRDE family protein n=1 Tax=Paraburkholderia phytofirmans OLGA172 TaxID=1417228 RepID=A0A160FL41_9BURK|nr:NRDE family protein [Paraburkholderia phytofirmans]ANB72826.1 NRDE family protein [Paraburkholderia phytofirmans OLGA172]
MCLIVFDWRPDAVDGPLFTLAANRDEFFRRTAEPISWWHDAPTVLAGRDLLGGGTWLGMSRDGRFAALTNYRAPHEMRADAPTRGTLVSDWLSGSASGSGNGQHETPLDYLQHVARTGDIYNGFNLIIGDWTRRELGWYCNRSNIAPTLLTPGTHGISNAVLDTAWPKLVKKRAELGAMLTREAMPPLERLIDLMRDPRLARDDELPSTGIPLERERVLSAAFIETPEYGTRGTTAVRVVAHGEVISVAAAERSDDNGSHRIVRPGDFERSFAFNVEREIA